MSAIDRVLSRWVRRSAEDEPAEDPKEEQVRQIYRQLETDVQVADRESPAGGKLWVAIDNEVRRLINTLPDFYLTIGNWTLHLREHHQAGVDEVLRQIDRILGRLRTILARIGRQVHDLEKVHRDVANEVAKLTSEFEIPPFKSLRDAAFAQNWKLVETIVHTDWVGHAVKYMIGHIVGMLKAMAKAHKPDPGKDSPLLKSVNLMQHNAESVDRTDVKNARAKLLLEVQRRKVEVKAEPGGSLASFILKNYATGIPKDGYGFMTPQFDQKSGRWIYSDSDKKSIDEIVQGYSGMLLKIPGVVAVAPGRSKKGRKPVVVVYVTHTGLSDVIPIKIEGYEVQVMPADELKTKEAVRPVPMIHKGDIEVYEHNVLTNPTVWGWWRRAPFRDPTLERQEKGVSPAGAKK